METRIIRLFAFFLVISFSGSGQGLSCGTTASAKDIEILKKWEPGSRGRINSNDPIYIALSTHIVRQSDGTGGLSEQTLEDAIAYLNESYVGTNMVFFRAGEIDYIDNDDFYDFDSSNESAITSPNNVPNTINVYFFNGLTSNSSPVCGYAYFPSSGRDYIMMANGCTNSSTFPHEVGHYFSLYHTHGKTNNGTTDELVSGTNCSVAGDDICDTPADPNLTGVVSGTCEYTGSAVDSNNQAFEPNPRNFMSYSLQGCRNLFTEEQKNRIVSAYTQFKSYLLSVDYVADFSSPKNIICEGEEIAFQNRSIGAVNYTWEFEGGNPSMSNEEHPVVIYSSAGEFDVTLTITEAGGETSIKQVVDNISVRSFTSSELVEKAGSFEEENIEEEILNEDNSVTFIKSSASIDGSNSAFMNFFEYNDVGQQDYLVFATLKTSPVRFFELTFDYAYAPYDELFKDGLAVVFRKPCEEWTTVWEKQGSDLQTSSEKQTLFRPTKEEDWRSQTVDIEIPEGVDIAEFAFRATNGFGNALYIDNYQIQIDDPTFDIGEVTVNEATCSDTPDGSISVSVIGFGDFLYGLNEGEFTSNNVFTDLAPGEYITKVKNDVNFVKTELVVLGFVSDYPPKPNISLIGDFLQINTSPGQTIQWFLDGKAINGENSASLLNPQSGSYTVELSNGTCSILSDPFVILAIPELETDLDIYPIPALNQLNVRLPTEVQTEINSMVVRDVSGTLLLHLREFTSVLDVTLLKPGMYLLEISSESHITHRRFIKQ